MSAVLDAGAPFVIITQGLQAAAGTLPLLVCSEPLSRVNPIVELSILRIRILTHVDDTFVPVSAFDSVEAALVTLFQRVSAAAFSK